MPGDALLGIDLGASSLKAVLIDAENGRVRGSGSHPVETKAPHPGWSEQQPEDWHQAMCRAVLQALMEGGVAANRVAAICVSAGAHTPVLLDRQEQVIRPAILWNDQRSTVEAIELRQPPNGRMIERTSLNRPNPTWTLAMLKWLRRYEPDTVARVQRLCLAKDYLRWRLTGIWGTDFSDVIGALMGDIETRDWSAKICALIDWPLTSLPSVQRATDVAGLLTAQSARETGLAAGTPVVVGSNDTTVELLAAGAIRPGATTIKLASSGVLSQVTDRAIVQPPISCYPHLADDLYYLATGTNAFATAQRWVHQRLFPELSFEAVDALAETAPAGSAGLIFHPYLQGERGPYWDADLRADFIGMTLRHGPPHFARAVLEGLAFSICDLLRDGRTRRLEFTGARLLGGGARSPLWRQIVADTSGLPLELPAVGDASFGAAMVAGLGIGRFAGLADAVQRCVRITGSVEPNMKRHKLYRELFEIYREAQQALAPIDRKLSKLFEF